MSAFGSRLRSRHGKRWAASVAWIVLMVAVSVGCDAIPQAPAGVNQYRNAGKDPNAWAVVPAGVFLEGQFNHSAEISYDYEVMATPVTNAQYAAYLEVALADGSIRLDGERLVGYYPGDPFHGGKHEEEIGAGDYLHIPLDDPAVRIDYDGEAFTVKAGYEDHPATMVSWFGAKAYCEAIGGRLPTELEWEKAARGTDGRPYPWGAEITSARANYYHSDDPFETPEGYSDTTPVGFYNGDRYGVFQTEDSPSPFGLYDMVGNVAEWTADTEEGTHYRFMRGGSKANYGYDLRVWVRNSAGPDYVSPSVGFRCVR